MKASVLRLGLAIAAVLVVSSCSGQVSGVPAPRPVANGSVENGRALIASYGCGSCHSVPGVPGADAVAAPPLKRFYERSFIAGRLSNTEENLIKWIQDPQDIEPGNAMPDLGVTEGDARDIAAYLYHEAGLGDMLSR